MGAVVVYLVKDLVFTSKIREAASHLGIQVASARDAEGLVTAAREARLVIVDLRLPEALGALEALVGDATAGRVPSVGFVDHERTDVMASARALGCGQVMAKGQFASALPELFGGLVASG
jgi:DNA-binding NarL/FixJ family response regulator